MASWFTVYCTRSVNHITAADLQAALNAVDFATVAEGFGIEDEAAVEQAVSMLRVEVPAKPHDIRYRVRYRPSAFRPLFVHLWKEKPRVDQELAEVEEHLEGRSESGVGLVRTLLSTVVEVTAVELGLSQLEDMGLVIAGQIAEFFAEAGAGPIRDTDDEWWTMNCGGPNLLVGRKQSS